MTANETTTEEEQTEETSEEESVEAEEPEETASIKPGSSRHATLTALWAAEETHEEPVSTGLVIDEAEELDFLSKFARSTMQRRMRTLYVLDLAERHGENRFDYSLTEAGQAVLDDMGPYDPEIFA